MQKKKSVDQVKQQIVKLGPVLPGSIGEQWNVCGTPGCKCKDLTNPKKHGPYYQLSFSVGGRSSSMFIKKEDLPEVRKRVKNYQELKKLVTDLIQANVNSARKSGFGRRS